MADLSPASFWVLTALAYGRSHKEALVSTVTDLSRGEVRIPLLLLAAVVNELEYAGLIRHDGVEPVSGRFLRYLTLTPRGIAALERQVETFENKAATARAALPPPATRTRRGPRT